MSYYKRKLIALLTIGAAVVVLYNIIDGLHIFASEPGNIPPFGWHWWLAMAYWLYVVGWVLLFKCAHCKKPQIYRGIHFSQWYWPSDKCWYCGSDLVKAHDT